MSFLVDVVTNVLANIIFWVVLGLAFAAYVQASKARFRRFFGLAPDLKLTICLSNLWSSSTSTQPNHRRARYYIGLNELKASQSILELFGTSAFRLPDMVRGLVDSMWSSSSKMVETAVSEPVDQEFPANTPTPTGSLVIVGSSRYNRRRRSFVESALPTMLFSTKLPEEDDRKAGRFAVLVERGPGAGDDPIESPLALGILEKCREVGTGRVVFFCIGAGGDISRAVSEFLVRNWGDLSRVYKDAPFAICLGFPREGEHLDSYVTPVRLREYRTQ